mmetsp:Transcript_54183/g.155713  ORF Transcript_54183/g.155713 Transcript_54183/m.155713 type:complete len:280 (-) Transcript_54183:143-982(-)
MGCLLLLTRHALQGFVALVSYGFAGQGKPDKSLLLLSRQPLQGLFFFLVARWFVGLRPCLPPARPRLLFPRQVRLGLLLLRQNPNLLPLFEDSLRRHIPPLHVRRELGIEFRFDACLLAGNVFVYSSLLLLLVLFLLLIILVPLGRGAHERVSAHGGSHRVATHIAVHVRWDEPQQVPKLRLDPVENLGQHPHRATGLRLPQKFLPLLFDGLLDLPRQLPRKYRRHFNGNLLLGRVCRLDLETNRQLLAVPAACRLGLRSVAGDTHWEGKPWRPLLSFG